jgi:hypothetical protein
MRLSAFWTQSCRSFFVATDFPLLCLTPELSGGEAVRLERIVRLQCDLSSGSHGLISRLSLKGGRPLAISEATASSYSTLDFFDHANTLLYQSIGGFVKQLSDCEMNKDVQPREPDVNRRLYQQTQEGARKAKRFSHMCTIIFHTKSNAGVKRRRSRPT